MPPNPLGALPLGPLGEYIREQRRSAQYSVRQLAQAAGVSNPYLSQIERGLRKPSAEILQQLAKALRISAETLYVKAGLLDGHPDGDADGDGDSADGPSAHDLHGSNSFASSPTDLKVETRDSISRQEPKTEGAQNQVRKDAQLFGFLTSGKAN